MSCLGLKKKKWQERYPRAAGTHLPALTTTGHMQDLGRGRAALQHRVCGLFDSLRPYEL